MHATAHHPPPAAPAPSAEELRLLALEERLDNLADLITRVPARKAYKLRRRWLQLRYKHHQLLRQYTRQYTP